VALMCPAIGSPADTPVFSREVCTRLMRAALLPTEMGRPFLPPTMPPALCPASCTYVTLCFISIEARLAPLE